MFYSSLKHWGLVHIYIIKTQRMLNKQQGWEYILLAKRKLIHWLQKHFENIKVQIL